MIFKYIPILIGIVCLFSGYAPAQVFNGKLVYQFDMVKVNPEVEEKSKALFGADFWENKSRITYAFLIKADTLVGKSFNNDGELVYREFQDENGAFVLYPGRDTIDYASLPMANMENLKLIKKEKQQKNILGFACQKYEYISDFGNGNTLVEAWIPMNFPYDKKLQTEGLFHKFIFPHGIAFEKRLAHVDGTEQLWQLKKISIFDVLATDIQSFLDNELE